MRSLDDRTGYLLRQYIDGSCSNEEFNELLALLKVQTDTSLLEELLLQEVQNGRYHEAEREVDWERMLLNIAQQPVQVKTAPVRKMFIWRRIAIAAVLLVCVAGIVFWWFQQSGSKKNITPPVALATDVPPGRNGAILTLQNGDKLLLDSAQNGVLTMLPGLHIVKHDSLIAYAPPGATASTAYNTLTTPRGRQFRVVLADGTKVWLNASSSIHYPAVFNDKERVVDITGEVYFEVAALRANSGQKMPFIVNIRSSTGGAGKGRVEVLGTHFNINAYDDEESVRTTLLEGKVKVSSIVNGQWSMLKPGQQVSLSHPDSYRGQLSQPILVQTDEVMAWKNGYFQFERADIQTVMRQIARWYDVDIQYEGAITKDKFGGSIPRDATLSQVLRALEQSLVHFTIQGKKVIVTP